MNKDIPRKIPRLKVRVKSRTKDFIMPDGTILKEGVLTEVVIYEDELAMVQAMVETEVDDIARAERKVKKTIDDIVDSKDRPAGISKEVARQELARSLSKEAAFNLIVGRDLLPLVLCEVVERGLPPPEQEAEFNALAASQKIATAQNAELARLVASEVAKAMRPNGEQHKSNNPQR
jgi:hypothetical protein